MMFYCSSNFPNSYSDVFGISSLNMTKRGILFGMKEYGTESTKRDMSLAPISTCHNFSFVKLTHGPYKN